jgi:hypothetical protein
MLRPSLIALCLMAPAAIAFAQTLSTAEALKHVGEQATVCGLIAGKHTAENAKGKPTFVDIDGAFPHQTFTVVIWEDSKSKVGEFPSSGNVCVTGKIAIYKEVPQIVLHDAKDWHTQPASAAK